VRNKIGGDDLMEGQAMEVCRSLSKSPEAGQAR
jgi:hypothetical protein